MRKRVEEVFGWLKTVGGREEAALLRRARQRPLGGDGSGGVQPRAHGQAHAPAIITGGGPCLLRMTCPNRRR